jgi:hypothetical protein
MKRIVLTAAASSLLALATPAWAWAAHNGTRHHRSHHAGARTRHAKRAQLLRFGASVPGAASGSIGTSTVTSPPASDEKAGTVASFAGGVLTIKLTDGSMVSGKVTDQTELQCQSPTPPQATTGEEDQGEGDDQNESDGGESGGPSTQAESSGQQDGDSQGGQGAGSDGEGNDDESDESCPQTALVAGAGVREAELLVSAGGSVWKRVELM